MGMSVINCGHCGSEPEVYALESLNEIISEPLVTVACSRHCTESSTVAGVVGKFVIEDWNRINERRV